MRDKCGRQSMHWEDAVFHTAMNHGRENDRKDLWLRQGTKDCSLPACCPYQTLKVNVMFPRQQIFPVHQRNSPPQCLLFPSDITCSASRVVPIQKLRRCVPEASNISFQRMPRIAWYAGLCQRLKLKQMVMSRLMPTNYSVSCDISISNLVDTDTDSAALNNKLCEV